MGNVVSGGGHNSCDFCDVISIENIFAAWKEFSKGKKSNKDVAEFNLRLEENLFILHEDLVNGRFRLDPYKVSIIQDPKKRTIHIASVRDRVLFQAVHRKLYHVFNSSFIYDVYSSRNQKGTHAGVKRLEVFSRKVSQNFTRQAYVLKCDIRKFFDSVDHDKLIRLISGKIQDVKLLIFIQEIIESFNHTPEKGLPLGNVTSQLFANIYMNEFDQFIKHKLKARYYIRYCDDFVILDESKEQLKSHISVIADFLKSEMDLDLHPRKLEIRKIYQGTDFLGYVSLPHYKVLRTSTKKRMLKKIARLRLDLETGLIDQEKLTNSICSYLGMLKHCRSEKIQGQIERIFWD